MMTSIKIHELLEQIGQNLHTIRNARKETLQGVAKAIGVTHPVLSKVENGRYGTLQFDLLIKLCNHYNISLQQVLALESATIFQLTQHNNNKDGNHKLIGQELGAGYELLLQQTKAEIQYLREQNVALLSLLEKA